MTRGAEVADHRCRRLLTPGLYIKACREAEIQTIPDTQAPFIGRKQGRINKGQDPLRP